MMRRRNIKVDVRVKQEERCGIITIVHMWNVSINWDDKGFGVYPIRLLMRSFEVAPPLNEWTGGEKVRIKT